MSDSIGVCPAQLADFISAADAFSSAKWGDSDEKELLGMVKFQYKAALLILGKRGAHGAKPIPLRIHDGIRDELEKGDDCGIDKLLEYSRELKEGAA